KASRSPFGHHVRTGEWLCLKNGTSSEIGGRTYSVGPAKNGSTEGCHDAGVWRTSVCNGDGPAARVGLVVGIGACTTRKPISQWQSSGNVPARQADRR